MAHVAPLSREQLAALEPVLAGAEANMGFVPNSMKTMAHMPQLTMAFSMLAGVVFGADLRPLMENFSAIVPEDENAGEALPPQLVQLIAYSVSLAAGCRYCQAHTVTLPSIRRVLMAGAPVSPELMRQMLTIIPNGEVHTPYGATEALPVSSIRTQEVLGAILDTIEAPSMEEREKGAQE